MTNIAKSLRSALSSLQAHLGADTERLHLAVAVVFSSIFWAHGVQVVVVGGQAATWWLRVSGSRDVDLVSSDFDRLRDALLSAGFRIADPQARFRLSHPGDATSDSVLIELVGEAIHVAGVPADAQSIATIEVDDVQDPAIRALMEGCGLVLDPCMAFLNYVDASSPESDWYEPGDEGSLAFERAMALLSLYRAHITTRLGALKSQGALRASLLTLLTQRFGLGDLPTP